MAECNSKAFISKPSAAVLIQCSLPMVGAIIALLAYDLFESMLLAYQEKSMLAAFGFTLPITTAMTALAIGMSIRLNNKVVRFNCSSSEKLPQEVSNSLFQGMVVVAIFALCFCLFNDQLLSLTGSMNLADSDSLASHQSIQVAYLDLRYLGWFALALIWQINAVLRALGWMWLASYLILGWMTVKSIIAFLVLSPESEFLATDFSVLGAVHLGVDGVFAVISFIALKLKMPLSFPSWKQIIKTEGHRKKDSTLVILQQFVTPLSMGIITAIVSTIDTTYVAALALVFRFEMLFLLLPMVLTTSVPAIIGANYWRGHQDRVRQIYMLAFAGITVVQLLVALVVFSHREWLSFIVCPHDGVSLHMSEYLNWVPWSYGAAGIAILFQSCLNAKSETAYALAIGLIHRLFFVLPLAIFGAVFYQEQGFYQGMMLGHAAVIIAVAFVLKRLGYLKTRRHKNVPTDVLSQTSDGTST